MYAFFSTTKRVIYLTKYKPKFALNIYRGLSNNKISVIEDHTFNNLPALWSL